MSISRRMDKYMWSVHVSKYHRSIKKSDLKLKVSAKINLKECNVENGYAECDIIYINSKMHNKYANS